MAVDFGGEFIKVSVVKPGRTPISIVPNEMSKRRTSAQVPPRLPSPVGQQKSNAAVGLLLLAL